MSDNYGYEGSVVTTEAAKSPTGALLMLHGTGSNGDELQYSVGKCLRKQSNFSHIKVIFPSASLIPFTPMGNCLVSTWFDVKGFTRDAREDEETIEKSANNLNNIIKNLTENGIPLSRIAIAGFSRGGAMSLHMGYRFNNGLAGVAVMSSFLSKSSKEIKSRGSETKFLQTHGEEDLLINIEDARDTYDDLRRAGLDGSLDIYSDLGHEISTEIFQRVFNFVSSVIPEI